MNDEFEQEIAPSSEANGEVEQETVANDQGEAVVAEPDATAADDGEMDDFSSFGFCEAINLGIKEAGFTTPTLIQQKAIPYVLQGRDVIGQALTGSGKTAAYGLPALELIQGKPGLQLLVLVPTRELAAQVSSELFKLGHHLEFHTAAFTGGQSYSRQEKLLREGLNALVATPGRLIDLMDSGHFDGMDPSIIVVDEADEMLDMGFLDDVRTIFEHFSGEHQTMLFSATMPKPVTNLAKTILHDPVDITTAITEATNNDIEQQFFVIEEHERVNAIIRLIDSEDVTKAMIFCRTREETDALNILLGGRGYNVNCLHGDMEQAQRSRVMSAFRRGEFDILVATDVAARGLDVDDVSHVFNFHLPFDSRGYVHRIGRTGRAGKSGRAITLVTPRELRQLEAIRRSVGADIQMGKIPTRHEVLAQQVQRVFGELFRNDLDPEMYNQVKAIAEGQDQDPLVLFTKLLTKQLRGNGDQGPEEIGITGERLERLLHGGRDRRGGRGDRGGRGGRGDRGGRFRREFRGEFDYDRPPRRSFDEERPPRRDDSFDRGERREDFGRKKSFRDGGQPEGSRDFERSERFESRRDFDRSDRPRGEFRERFRREEHFDGPREDRPRGEFRERFRREDRPREERRFDGEEPAPSRRFEGTQDFQSRFARYEQESERDSRRPRPDKGGESRERAALRKEHRDGVKFARDMANDIERKHGGYGKKRDFERDGDDSRPGRGGDTPYWEKFSGHKGGGFGGKPGKGDFKKSKKKKKPSK